MAIIRVAKVNIAIKVSKIVKASPPFLGVSRPPLGDLLGIVLSYNYYITTNTILRTLVLFL
ncbi:hypothetical protein BCI9360_03687 [Bacillus sp. CECT 9360]|nr:hypothetical protein BCI9360_03687 [Bacillus sp. CECT 9360]